MVHAKQIHEKQISTLARTDPDSLYTANPIFAVWCFHVRTINQAGLDGLTTLEVGQLYDAARKMAKGAGSDGAWYLRNVDPFLRQFVYCLDFYNIAVRGMSQVETNADIDVRDLEAQRVRYAHVLLSIHEMICELAMPGEPFYALSMFPDEPDYDKRRNP